jgi:hypothetical protein
MNPSMSEWHSSSVYSSCAATARGANAGSSIRRVHVWIGGSAVIGAAAIICS